MALVVFLHFLLLCIFRLCCMFFFLFVKPSAPEAQRLDDAIGFLRDHVEATQVIFCFFYFSSFQSPYLCMNLLASFFRVEEVEQFF